MTRRGRGETPGARVGNPSDAQAPAPLALRQAIHQHIDSADASPVSPPGRSSPGVPASTPAAHRPFHFGITGGTGSTCVTAM